MAISGPGAGAVTVVSGTVISMAVFALGLALTGRTPVAMTSCQERVYDRLFFGLGTAEGRVSHSEWERFLSDVVTPRFPDGLTVVEANGQWRAAGEQGVTVERSRVVEIAHDDSSEVDRRLGEIVAIYKQRHRQRSVMLTRARMEVCW